MSERKSRIVEEGDVTCTIDPRVEVARLTAILEAARPVLESARRLLNCRTQEEEDAWIEKARAVLAMMDGQREIDHD